MDDQVVRCGHRCKSRSNGSLKRVVSKLSYIVGTLFGDSESDIFGCDCSRRRTNYKTDRFIDISIDSSIIEVSKSDSQLTEISYTRWQCLQISKLDTNNTVGIDTVIASYFDSWVGDGGNRRIDLSFYSAHRVECQTRNIQTSYLVSCLKTCS